ncbi:MAG: alpha/beta hydrolase [Myxococcales bacterium]
MKRLFLLLPLAVLAAACDPEDPPLPAGPDAGATPVSPCRQVLDAKLEKYGSDLGSWSTADLPAMADSAEAIGSSAYAGHYRELANGHPGCVPRATYDGKLFLNGLNEAVVAPGVPLQGSDSSKPGYVPGFPCAGKEYTPPSGVALDSKKPIVVLVHGNSSSPNSWEEYSNSKLQDQNSAQPGSQLKSLSQFELTADTSTRPMLASRLVGNGHRVIAVDFRTDLVMTLAGANPAAGPKDPAYGDGGGNIDHGWATPILQSLLKALMQANPDAQISLVGHSLGYTVIQDSLRRLFNEHRAGKLAFNPLTRIKSVVLASGAAHGVASGAVNCSFYKTMRGAVNCEMGDRDNWQATAFNKLLDGPEDLYSTPCADGSFAYGKFDQCGGHAIRFTTVTMRDPEGGKLQDEFVSEAASRLNMDQVELDGAGKRRVTHPACVDNHLIELSDFDSSGFFMDVANLQGFLANHFGSIRSEAGMEFIETKLAE